MPEDLDKAEIETSPSNVTADTMLTLGNEHVRPPYVLGGFRLNKYSPGVELVLTQIFETLERKMGGRIEDGVYESGDMAGKPRFKSPMAWSTRMMLSIYALTCEREALRAFMFNAEDFLARALTWFDSQPDGIESEAARIYNEIMDAYFKAKVEPVHEKSAEHVEGKAPVRTGS